MTKVYTGTMNLAIDLFIETERMLASKVNRTLSDDVQANGKGVNVSFIMKPVLTSTVFSVAGRFGQAVCSFILKKEKKRLEIGCVQKDSAILMNSIRFPKRQPLRGKIKSVKFQGINWLLYSKEERFRLRCEREGLSLSFFDGKFFYDITLMINYLESNDYF